MKIQYPLTDAYTYSAEEIIQTFQTDLSSGLSQAEAEKRNREFGPNIFQAKKPKSLLRMFGLQFKSPIVYLLLFAASVTLYFQHYAEAISIVVVILINALIGFIMELQARNSMKALKEMDVTLTRVMRESKIQEIPAEKIVPGDILLLEAGDIIPGDARLAESIELQCDESSLTGESLPTEKNTEKLPPETSPGDQFNMVFKGASVTKGKGKAIITGISQHTQLGIITTLVEESEEIETPLDKQIGVLSKKLIWITLGLTAIFALTGFIQGKSGLLILETSIALAVAAFPEGLPIVATVALSFGMLQMAKRNAIVKKLSAVETLGSTNVILTDKTGTLTENKIFADTLAFPEETLKGSTTNHVFVFEKKDISHLEETFQKLKLTGVLCNNAYPKNENGDAELFGDPLEIALLHLADSSGTSAAELKAPFERIDEIPFSSETRMMATLNKSQEGYFVAVKGSVEHLLQKCSQVLNPEGIAELSETQRNKILSEAEKMAAEGLRVLAFAYQEGPEIAPKDYVQSLIYTGMAGFVDPPRADIKEAIGLCRKAGIKIAMITGDHPLTALHIAIQTGVADPGETNVITGADLPSMESLSDEWKKIILDTKVFARTTPRQKLDIVSVYQEAGNIVAMTGDGINDAPALKKANIGIAMGIRGTQVAKETAGIVLKDDSFISIERAVAQGRAIFDNIQKFVIYLISCNLSEICIVTIMGFIAPASTLLPLQILFLNMVTDVFPALALGLGRGNTSVMEKPPRQAGSMIVSGKKWIAVYTYSLLITLAVLIAMMYCKYQISEDAAMTNHIAFLTLAFAQIFHVFNMSSIRSHIMANEITQNKFVWIAIVLCIALLLLAYAIPQVRGVLGLEGLSSNLWLIAAVAGCIPLGIVQSYKILFQIWATRNLNVHESSR